MIQINSTVKQKLAKVLCLPELPIPSDNTAMSESDQKPFGNMLSKIATKSQNNNSTRAEKLLILTITPDNWSRGKAASVFSVSEKMVRCSEISRQYCSVFIATTTRRKVNLKRCHPES